MLINKAVPVNLKLALDLRVFDQCQCVRVLDESKILFLMCVTIRNCNNLTNYLIKLLNIHYDRAQFLLHLPL